jgi:hypothetical protein
MEAIQDLRQPLRSKGIVGSRGGNPYQPNHALKFSVCRIHLKVIDRILPSDDLQTPVLWHKDLHLDNIFVDPQEAYGDCWTH